MTAGNVPDARDYAGFADLARAQREGHDFRIEVLTRPHSDVAIVAPHGGGIEDGTSELARAVADDDLNLYLFEGCRPAYNYRALHLTSHRFDEPRCLALLERCERVVTVHGCDGEDPVILAGGLDVDLARELAAALERAQFEVATEGHRFPATNPANICNRGARGRGVQLEIPHRLRRGESVGAIARALRAVLAAPLPR